MILHLILLMFKIMLVSKLVALVVEAHHFLIADPLVAVIHSDRIARAWTCNATVKVKYPRANKNYFNFPAISKL